MRVIRADLERVGLLTPAGGTMGPIGALEGSLDPADLLDRIVDQAEQLGRYRLLAERSESLERKLEAERETHERTREEAIRLRAELETSRRRWWQRGG